jgi:hypothetical protein
VAVLAANTPASAMNWVNGNQLWDWCKPGNSILCLGYVAGIANAMAASNNSLLGWHACLRENLTVGQVVDVVKLYLSNHPEKRDYAAAALVAEAYEKAFHACRQGSLGNQRCYSEPRSIVIGSGGQSGGNLSLRTRIVL